MKHLLLALCFILPLFVSSSVVSSNPSGFQVDPFLKSQLEYNVLKNIEAEDDKFFSISDLFSLLMKILTYDIDITIDPSSSPNFEGLLFTTQQFSSLFPTMKGMNPPQNVSLHIHMPLDILKIFNFTGYHLGLNLDAQLTVLLPGQTLDNPFTTFSLQGLVHLEVLPVLLGVRVYIEDYNVQNITIPESEASKINGKAVMQLANSFGQLGVDYGNQILGQKIIRPETESEAGQEDSDSFGNNNQFFIHRETKAVFQGRNMRIEAIKRQEKVENIEL